MYPDLPSILKFVKRFGQTSWCQGSNTRGKGSQGARWKSGGVRDSETGKDDKQTIFFYTKRWEGGWMTTRFTLGWKVVTCWPCLDLICVDGVTYPALAYQGHWSLSARQISKRGKQKKTGAAWAQEHKQGVSQQSSQATWAAGTLV